MSSALFQHEQLENSELQNFCCYLPFVDAPFNEYICGNIGGSHRQSFCTAPPAMPVISPASTVAAPPVTAMFIIRRFASLRLASNGPGTELPCRLEILDSVN